MRGALVLAAMLMAGCTPPPLVTMDEVTVEAHLTAVPARRSIEWAESLEAAAAASRADGWPIMVFFEFDA